MSVNSYLSRLDRNTAIDAAAAVAARAMATPATFERVKMYAGLTPAAADLVVLSGHQPDMAEVVQAIDPTGAVPWYARSSFYDISTQAAQTLARSVPPPSHRAFMAIVPAADFKATTVKFGFYGAALQEVNESGEYSIYRADAGESETTVGNVTNYGCAVGVYREELINDRSLGFLGRLGEGLVGSAYRHEAALAYATIEGNPNLADGQPWFDATNSVSAPSLLQALIDGFALFHEQSLPNGALLNAAPAVLVIPPRWSIQASDVLSDILLNIGRLTVIKSGAVSSAYLFASPAEFPAVGLLALNAGGIPELAVQPRPRSGFISDMESLTKVSHPVAVMPLSRRGVVKMSVES
jgi:hypothetical protein